MKVWDQARIDHRNPGSAVRHKSAIRHVTDWATRPGPFGALDLLAPRAGANGLEGCLKSAGPKSKVKCAEGLP